MLPNWTNFLAAMCLWTTYVYMDTDNSMRGTGEYKEL